MKLIGCKYMRNLSVSQIIGFANIFITSFFCLDFLFEMTVYKSGAYNENNVDGLAMWWYSIIRLL